MIKEEDSGPCNEIRLGDVTRDSTMEVYRVTLSLKKPWNFANKMDLFSDQHIHPLSYFAKLSIPFLKIKVSLID